MTSLSQTILDLITASKSHAQAPMRVDNLIGWIGPLDGATLEEVDTALDVLFDARLINRVRRERDGETWYEVWPTGVIGAAPTWRALPTRRPTVPPPPATPKKHKEPETMSDTTCQPTGWAKTMLAVIAEHGPIKGSVLASKAGCNPTSVSGYTAQLVDAGLVVKRRAGRNTWMMTPGQVERYEAMSEQDRAADASHDKTRAPAPSNRKSRKEKLPKSAGNDAGLEIPTFTGSTRAQTKQAKTGMQFLVADDASLTIVDADEILRIPPAEACRLAEFLRDCAPVFGA